MENNNDKRLFISYIVSWVAIIIIIILLIRSCSGKSTGIKYADNDSVFYWKNKYGDAIASLKKKEEEFAKHQLNADSLAKVLNTTSNRLKEYVVIYSKTKDSLKVARNKPPEIIYDVLVDSVYRNCPPAIKSLKQVFANNYHTADVKIDTKNTDSSYAIIQSVDTLTIAWKRVKEGGLFNKKHFLQIDASNANPNNTIVGLKAYRVPEKKQKKIGIGIQAGYGIDDNFIARPYIGIGISYNFIRL